MICRNCGKDIPLESVYCMFCGAPVFSARRDDPAPAPVPAAPAPIPAAPVPPAPVITPEPAPREAAFHFTPGSSGEPEPSGRVCVVCGCPLPENIDSDCCDSCRFILDFASETALPDDSAPEEPAKKEFKLELNLDGEFGDYPEPKKKGVRKKPSGPRPKWLLPAIIGSAVLLVAAIFFLIFQLKPPDESRPADSASASMPSQEEQDAVSCAQEMVKAAARDPASVHFQKRTLEITRDAETYVVTQQFERANAAGEIISASYEARLTLAPSGDKAYTPLLLAVGGEILFDYR